MLSELVAQPLCKFDNKICLNYTYIYIFKVFSWSGNLFLIAPFPDLCLLVPFYIRVLVVVPCGGPKKSPRTSI